MTVKQSFRPDPASVDRVSELLRKEMDEKTYGKITVHMEAGHIVRVTTERNEIIKRKK